MSLIVIESKKKLLFICFSLVYFVSFHSISGQSLFPGLWSYNLVATATLTGHVYADTNGNGMQDTSEPNLPNVNMVIMQSKRIR